MAEHGLMHRTTNAATCNGSVGSNPTLDGLPRKMANKQELIFKNREKDQKKGNL